VKWLVFLLLITAAGTSSGPASAAACAPGSAASSGACAPLTIPENAHLNVSGDGWICNFGFERRGQKCTPVVVPWNASLGRNSDVWTCNPGYYEKRGICLPEESAEQTPKTRPDFKALREAAARQWHAGEKMRNAFLLVVALVLSGMGLLMIGRRESLTTSTYAAPRPNAFRPYQAIVAGADAWLAWGERIDGLTGGPIAEGVAVTQCPVCQTCYGAESVVVLRRENGARCLACGSRILRQPLRTKFQTVLDTAVLPAR